MMLPQVWTDERELSSVCSMIFLLVRGDFHFVLHNLHMCTSIRDLMANCQGSEMEVRWSQSRVREWTETNSEMGNEDGWHWLQL